MSNADLIAAFGLDDLAARRREEAGRDVTRLQGIVDDYRAALRDLGPDDLDDLERGDAAADLAEAEQMLSELRAAAT